MIFHWVDSRKDSSRRWVFCRWTLQILTSLGNLRPWQVKIGGLIKVVQLESGSNIDQIGLLQIHFGWIFPSGSTFARRRWLDAWNTWLCWISCSWAFGKALSSQNNEAAPSWSIPASWWRHRAESIWRKNKWPMLGELYKEKAMGTGTPI